MSATHSEIALSRVLAYLRLSRIPLTREVMLEALSLVQEVLRGEARVEPLLERLMERLRDHFPLPSPALPPVCPSIRRGSIHYDD